MSSDTEPFGGTVTLRSGARLAGAAVVPHVNQVEFHPFLAQPELVSWCREVHGVNPTRRC